MILLVDIGNTNIVFGLVDSKDKLLATYRLVTKRDAIADHYHSFLAEKNLEPRNIKDVVVSSVVPQTKTEFEKFCLGAFGKKPYDISEHISDIGIKVLLEKPEEVGADRLVNAIAAYEKYKRPCIIIDFGTATTFDVVSEKGEYLGGMISPGVKLAVKALTEAAAKLPDIKIEKPLNIIGKTTVQAMQSGIYYGYLGLIEASVEKISLELAQKPLVLATGGLARFFAESKVIDSVEEDLTLNGLLLIYRRNNGKKT